MADTWLLYLVLGGGLFYVLGKLVRWFSIPVISAKYGSPSNASHSFYDPTTNSLQQFPTVFDHAEVDLSLIVPAYSEEERLPIMMDETLTYLEERCNKDVGFSYEIIVIDDGSKDKTTEVALKYSKKHSSDKVRVLTLKANQGKGFAVQQGMLCARGERLLMCDADGASKIDDVAKLEASYEQILKNGDAIAVGSRAHLQKKAEAVRSFHRNLLMHGFHLATQICVRGVRDTQCGFKLFSRKTAQKIFPSQHLRRWCFDVELLFLAGQLNVPITEVGIEWKEVPGSKLELIDSSFQMARDLILIRCLYFLGVWKLKSCDDSKQFVTKRC